MIRVLVSLAILMLLSSALLIFVGVTVFMAPLGILLLFKIYGAHYLAFGLFSILAMIYGVAVFKRIHGPVIAGIGLLSWMFLGAYGLGHGG